MTFRELSTKEFDNFSYNYYVKSVYQTSAYGITMGSQNFYSYYLGLFDNDKLIAATFVMVKTDGGFKYGYVPRGYLLDYNNEELVTTFSKNLKKFLSSKGVVAIKLNPPIVKNIYDYNYDIIASNPEFDKIVKILDKNGYTHLGFNNYFESFKPRFEALIDLNNNYVELFKNMSKQFKTKVRSAESNGVRIYKGNQESLELLYNQAKKKYPRNLLYYQNLYSNLDKNKSIEIYYAKLDANIYLEKNQKEYLEQEKINNELNAEVLKNKGTSHQKLINKKIEADKKTSIYHKRLVNAINLAAQNKDGILLAVVLVAKINDTVDVILDSYDEKFKTFSAKHLILWKLIEKYSKEGYKLLNLGGVVHKVDKKDKYHGLNEFKLSLGSKIYEYIGDMEFVTNKPMYIMYRNAAPFFRK